MPPGAVVSVAAGAGPTAGRGLPLGQGGPGLAGRWPFPVPRPRLPGAVRAKAVILRLKGPRGPCGGSRGEGRRPYRTAGTGQRHIRSGDFSLATSGDTHLAIGGVGNRDK